VFLPALRDAGNRVTHGYHLSVVLLYDVEHYNNCKSVTPIWDPDLGPRFGILIWGPSIRNYTQLYATICNYMQLYATICDYMQLYATICNYMQLYATIPPKAESSI
jgi:hypothetical protein